MTDAAATPSPSSVALRLAGGLLAMFLVVALLGLFLRHPIAALAGRFVDAFGLLGVAAGVFVLDVVPVSTHDPMLFAGHAGGLDGVPLAAVGMAASIVATWVDFGVGWAVGRRLAPVQRLADWFGVPALLERHGAWAVAVAAVLPVPFALVAWASGMSGGSFRHVVVGSFLRATKVLLTVTLITLGWGLGG